MTHCSVKAVLPPLGLFWDFFHLQSLWRIQLCASHQTKVGRVGSRYWNKIYACLLLGNLLSNIQKLGDIRCIPSLLGYMGCKRSPSSETEQTPVNDMFACTILTRCHRSWSLRTHGWQCFLWQSRKTLDIVDGGMLNGMSHPSGTHNRASFKIPKVCISLPWAIVQHTGALVLKRSPEATTLHNQFTHCYHMTFGITACISIWQNEHHHFGNIYFYWMYTFE